ncbi:Tetratricopeptide repeat superfamily protein [Perilla frutescens var. frutescens]|nr:Tetratricopeptide repeat superfamily protein [Perilla frutescens var. frutescens]
MQEKALNLHSERLALAYGLITLKPTRRIQIVKNLHVCEDCHSMFKLVSKLYDREIVLRDRYHFHHFKGGSYSYLIHNEQSSHLAPAIGRTECSTQLTMKALTAPSSKLSNTLCSNIEKLKGNWRFLRILKQRVIHSWQMMQEAPSVL